MLKNNKQKGITLISLVITVIILLILATVAINLAVDSNGLFGKAGQASNKWNESVATEESALNGLIGTLDEMTYVHSWTRTGDQVTCSHCGLNCTIGLSRINYVPDFPTENVVLSGEKSGTGTDQVIYDVTATSKLETNASVATAENNAEKQEGYVVEKVIKVENEEKLIEISSIHTKGKNIGEEIWVVLGIADEDEDGVNESLLITSLEPVSQIAFRGAAAYNYGPDELETICRKLYSSSIGTARSITIEDVNEALRYIPEGGMYYDGSSGHTTGNFTTKLNELGIIWDSIRANGTRTPDGTNTEAALGEYILDGYAYMVSEGGYLVSIANSSDTSHPISEIINEARLIFSIYEPCNYWMASRSVFVGNKNGNYYTWFALENYFSNSLGIGSGLSLFGSPEGAEETGEAAFRPVVSLKNEIPSIYTIP